MLKHRNFVQVGQHFFRVYVSDRGSTVLRGVYSFSNRIRGNKVRILPLEIPEKLG